MSDTETLRSALQAATEHPLEDLDSERAGAVADRLRAVVAALPPTTAADARLTEQLIEAAEVLGRGSEAPQPGAG